MSDRLLRNLAGESSPGLADLLYLLHDPAGTPTDRKLTLQSLFDLVESNLRTDGTYTPVFSDESGNDSATSFTAGWFRWANIAMVSVYPPSGTAIDTTGLVGTDRLRMSLPFVCAAPSGYGANADWRMGGLMLHSGIGTQPASGRDIRLRLLGGQGYCTFVSQGAADIQFLTVNDMDDDVTRLSEITIVYPIA